MKIAAILILLVVVVTSKEPYEGPRPEIVKNCNYCQYVIEDLVEAYNKGLTEVNAVNLGAEEICSVLEGTTAQWKAYCEFMLNGDNAIQVIWTAFGEGKKPEQICTLIRHCQEPRSEIVKNCYDCKYVIADLAQADYNGLTEGDALSLGAEQICSVIEGTTAHRKAYCNFTLNGDNATQVIWTAFVERKKPEQICTLIGHCQEPRPKIVKNCNDCKHLIADLVQAELTEMDAANLGAERICSVLEGTTAHRKAYCNFTLKEEGEMPVIWTAFRQTKNPEQICTLISHCHQPRPKIVKNCDYCEYVMTDLIEGNDWRLSKGNAVALGAEKICSGIQGTADRKAYCVFTLNKEKMMQVIWTAFCERKKPKEICTRIGHCPVPPPKIVKNCNDCKHVMAELTQDYKHRATIGFSLDQGAEQICSGIEGNSSIIQYCMFALNGEKAMRAIRTAIGQGKKPKEICTIIGHCLRSPTECNNCFHVLAELRRVFDFNGRVDDVLGEGVWQTCSGMKATYFQKAYCRNWLGQQGVMEDIWTAFGNNKQPKELCTEFYYCPQNMTYADNAE